MKNCLLTLTLTLTVWAFADLVDFVDPFIGTAATGHTFPAACVPFGLVQAGADTGNRDWHHCSGYRYSDTTICGFTQTHVNGTGCMDLGDVRLMPLAPGATGADCRQPFSHRDEVATPGYYSVKLPGLGTFVEVSVTAHAALYRFHTEGGALRLLVDCAYGITGRDPIGEIHASEVRRTGLVGLAGTNARRSWVSRSYSFAVAFSRAAEQVEELPKAKGQKAPQYVYTFKEGADVLVKVGLSAEGNADTARANLAAEIPGWDLDAVKRAARGAWESALAVAEITGTDEQKRSWYTSLYHLFIQPNNLADVGQRPFYSTFSCWDTFRAAGPLYTLLCPERAAAFVDSMLEQGRRTGFLPIWTLWGKDNQCMIGTHSIPMIVDWFLKSGEATSSSLRNKEANRSAGSDGDVASPTWEAAYRQIKETLTKRHEGRVKENWDVYDRYGYYPFDLIKGESVSRTMECAYDDWCAGTMAEKLGHREDAAFFFKRSGYWKNVFDPSIGFVRGKDSKGGWRTPYDPYALGHGADRANDFTEGNAFQYSWHVMQDVPGLVAAMGGREAFVKKLDSLFEAPTKTEGMGEVLDVTGLIGQYVHGNEPSHHVIYFYPQVGQPEKAAERIREVFDKFYLPKPDGLCGNDDCGQMSAWYLFSAMGFYPFNPCGGDYVIGAPQVEKAVLKLKGGRTFTVVAKNLSAENKYVKSVVLNGKPVTDWKIRHEDIVNGGSLLFEMGRREPSEDAFRLYNIVPMYVGHEKEQAARCVDYCARTGEELALYCLTLHPEGVPAKDKVDRCLASYRAFAKALEGTKVRPGILVQAILGHWRRIDKKIEPWMRSVDHEGKDARFCPLDPDYAAYITYVFTEIAKCDPAFIMTDDDVRAFVYGGTGAECFCERHVAKFNALRGTHHDSASLRKTIRACRQGDADYLAFNRIERELVEDLVLGRGRAAIDAVNPRIPGGACLSNSWALFGAFAARRMNAAGQRPVLRLPTGCYYERLSADRWPATVLKMQRYFEYYRDCGIDLLDEADKCPHNLWSKTARAFYTHLVTAAFVGLRGAKVWFVNGLKETGTKVTEKYTDVLAAHRGQLDAVASAVAGTQPVGLAAPCFTNAPAYHPTENCLGYFSEATDLEKNVFAFGIPVAASRDFGNRRLVFTLSTKAEVARLTDEEIRRILSGRALVLREAAVALDARGFASLLGTGAKEEPLQFTYEYDLMNKSYVRHVSSYAGSVRFTPAKGARVLSEFRYEDSATGENARVAPAAVYAENALGGKVVTSGYHGEMLYLDVYSEERQRWFVSVVDLLTDPADRFTVCREAQDMLVCERRAADGTRYVLAMNMSSEPVDDLRVRAWDGARVERLEKDGRWSSEGKTPLGFYEAVVLRVR